MHQIPFAVSILSKFDRRSHFNRASSISSSSHWALCSKRRNHLLKTNSALTYLILTITTPKLQQPRWYHKWIYNIIKSLRYLASFLFDSLQKYLQIQNYPSMLPSSSKLDIYITFRDCVRWILSYISLYIYVILFALRYYLFCLIKFDSI